MQGELVHHTDNEKEMRKEKVNERKDMEQIDYANISEVE